MYMLAHLLKRRTGTAASSTANMRLDDRLQSFLLLRGPRGEEPRRLHSMRALYLSMLVAPPDERQNLMLVLCEMVALISGLMTPIPLSLLGSIESRATHHDTKGWDVLPSVQDGIDAVLVWCFIVYIGVVFGTVLLAMLIVMGGGLNDPRLCEAALDALVNLIMSMLIGACLPFTAVLFWLQFSVATVRMFSSASSFSCNRGPLSYSTRFSSIS